MMYHFMLGLRGGSSAPAASGERFSPPAPASFFSSSCIDSALIGCNTSLPSSTQCCLKYRNTESIPWPITRSTAQKYAANRKTVTITTTVVACTSLNEGAVTFFISVRTALEYVLIRSGQDLMVAVSVFCSATLAMDSSRFPSYLAPKTLAGAEGCERPSAVLETDSLTVELTPLYSLTNFVIYGLTNLNSTIRKSVN